MFPWQATPKLVKLLQDVVFVTKVNRKYVLTDRMRGHEPVTDRGYWMKPVKCKLLTTPAHSKQNIEPPFLPANLHRRVGRTSTHNNPELICSSNWIFPEIKWRAHIAPNTVSQRELRHASAIASYPVFFWIVCARFWTWRTPLWDGGGFVLRYSAVCGSHGKPLHVS